MSYVRSAVALLLSSIVSLAACGGDDESPDSRPTVSVSATPSSGLTPLSVSFTADVVAGDAPLTFVWDFGDGSALSDEVSPTHIYDAIGSFDATVTVVDADGDTDSATVSITVGSDSMPAVTAAADPAAGRAPLDVSFSCTVAGGAEPVVLRWDFGDGTGFNGADASHTYISPGTFTATCIGVDAAGEMASDQVTVEVSRNDAPVAIASASFEGSEVPLVVDFTGDAVGGDGALTYAWTFGDGGSSTEQSPTHTYSGAGLFTAVLTVTDEDGDRGVDTIRIPVEPADGAPTAVATIVSGACAIPGFNGTEVELDASTSADPEGLPLFYEWVFVRIPSGSSVDFNNSEVENPTFRPDREGDYEIRVFVSDGTNRVASAPVTVTASGPSILAAVSGDMQSAQAGEPFGSPLVVRVTNTCGAPIEGLFVDWNGTNAFPNPRFPTDDMGQANADAGAGTRAGPASATASVRRLDGTDAVVTFDLTVTAGDPEKIIFDPVGPAAAGSPTGMPLTFRITDTFGNPTPTASASFDVCTFARDASFAPMLPTPCVSLTTTGGTATATLYKLSPGPVPLELAGSMPPLQFGGWLQVASADFEATDPRFTPGADPDLEQWEQGAPMTVGPTACATGTGCFGTDLDADYVPASFRNGNSFLELTLDPGPYGPLGMIERVEVVQREWYDVPTANPDDFLCFGPDYGGGFSITLESPAPFRGIPLEPERGFDLFGCSPGASNGTSGGWVTSRYSADRGGFPPFRVGLYWNLVRGGNSTTGAGWYIDDVEVNALVLDFVSVLFVGECGDGIDNDMDGIVDFPFDPGCTSPSDTDETDPPIPPACANGRDDDMDGDTDFPDDPDCDSASDDSEADPCNDGIDNDGDGWVDFMDPGCFAGPGGTEDNPPFAGCSDGIDNDGDMLVDGNDPDCFDPFMDEGRPMMGTCFNGMDDDGDGWIDRMDPDCLMGMEETGRLYPMFECNDGRDNDGDMGIDVFDPDCIDGFGTEDGGPPPMGTCFNGFDDDGDGWDDMSDPDCIFGSPDEMGFDPMLECNDGLDNDMDMNIDADDPDCFDAIMSSEFGPFPPPP